MAIYVHEGEKRFHLQSKDMSYIIQVMNGYPAHAYWGKKLRDDELLNNLIKGVKSTHLDHLAQEYPQYGSGDFRHPAYQAKLTDGTRITEFVYKGHRIVEGKPPLKGLPAVYVESASEAHTLELELEDKYSGLHVILSYTVFEKHNAMTRSARFVHQGSGEIRLLRALSASVDFSDSDFEALYLSGAWSREGRINRTPIAPGEFSIGSKRGMSSHQLNPFFALVRPDTTEDQGDVFGFSLVYSGNHSAQVEVDQFHSARVSIGINPFDFGWVLKPGESFQTPEAVMVYSNEGIGGMSRIYHRLYRTRLSRGVYRDQERPILVNNWEATYFNFNADKIEHIAKAGAELGIELFVLDDGWFGKRNDDTTSLGDWIEDRNKLPGGLEDLAKRVNNLGLKFGLWVEPEMISPDSDLYRQHPDWCLHVPGRRRSEARTQLVLDYSRKEVVDTIFDALSAIFSRVPVAYQMGYEPRSD